MFSLALIIFVVSEKKAFEHFPIESNVNLFPAVSEEKNLKNHPIRNKNCLWWPCLLTDRGRNERSL